MTIIQNWDELYSYINEALIAHDLHDYNEDDFEDFGTKLYRLLQKQGFEWGDNIYDFEITEEQFWDCLS